MILEGENTWDVCHPKPDIQLIADAIVTILVKSERQRRAGMRDSSWMCSVRKHGVSVHCVQSREEIRPMPTESGMVLSQLCLLIAFCFPG